MSDRRTFGAGKKAAIFVNVVVMVALAAVAAGFTIYLLSFTRLRLRLDLTQSANYSLTPQSIEMLAGLDRDVEIVTVTDPAATGTWDPDGAIPRAMEYVRDLLQEYKVRAAGRLSIENLDVQHDPGRVRDVQREVGILFYNFVLVKCGKNKRLLQLDPDLAEFVRGDVNMRRATSLVAYRVEEALSSAIFGALDEKKPQVYVITGHDEVAISQNTPEGGALLATSLGRDNVAIADWSLFQTKKIPDDADAVFLLGPQSPLVQDERAAIDAYLRKGGHMLVCIDPFCDPSLDDLWGELGVELERNVITSPVSSVTTNQDPRQHYIGPTSGGSYGSHAIVDGLKQRSLTVVLDQCAAIRPKPGSEKPFTTLLTSYRNAFGDVPDPKTRKGDLKWDKKTETEGQRIFGAALEFTEGPYSGARVVFMTSWAWLRNDAIRSYQGNDELLRRATGWLVGKKKGAIAPPPRLPPPTVSELKADEYDMIATYTMLVLPGGALLLAILVWFARRN